MTIKPALIIVTESRRLKMSYSLLKQSIFFIAIFLLGCVSPVSPEMQQLRKKLTFDYYDCVVDKCKSLDDGVSSIKDVATSAIFACANYENAKVQHYEAFLQEEVRYQVRKGAFKVATWEIVNNRNKMATNKQ